jgi:TonB family protein
MTRSRSGAKSMRVESRRFRAVDRAQIISMQGDRARHSDRSSRVRHVLGRGSAVLVGIGTAALMLALLAVLHRPHAISAPRADSFWLDVLEAPTIEPAPRVVDDPILTIEAAGPELPTLDLEAPPTPADSIALPALTWADVGRELVPILPRSTRIADVPPSRGSAGSPEGQHHRAGDEDGSKVDAEPRGLWTPEPKYPRRAQARGIEGDVVLRFVVDELGRVADIEVLKGDLGGPFAEAAKAAVAEWRFEPARHSSKPVRLRVKKLFQFRMSGSTGGVGS